MTLKEQTDIGTYLQEVLVTSHIGQSKSLLGELQSSSSRRMANYAMYRTTVPSMPSHRRITTPSLSLMT
jgi:hypothetical protein